VSPPVTEIITWSWSAIILLFLNIEILLPPRRPEAANAWEYSCTQPISCARRTEVERAIREAWAWLESAALLIEAPGYRQPTIVRALSQRARQLAQEPDARGAFSARQIQKEALHHRIREDVWALDRRGKYDTAVFEAMKAIEVRIASGLSAADRGTDLMRKAFDPTHGPLTAPVHRERGTRGARASFRGSDRLI
jgi:uncharacterized protein Ymh